jgi:hypothetical protein
MVRFATQLAPLFLVRERVSYADGYRPVRGRVALVEEDQAAAESAPAAESGFHDRCGLAAAFETEADGCTTPVPDPVDDVDALEELEDEICTLAAHIHAATQRLLVLIADFDRRRGWELGGHRSCAHWLHARTGIDLGAAREQVRTARALVGLPQTSASMARGELSFSQVRSLSRVATPANEADLLELARGCTTAVLERKVRAFRQGSLKDEAAWEKECWESRTLSVFPDDDGMYLVRGRVPAEVGALLMRAVEAASDALYREKRVPWLETRGESQRAAAQRRADALGLLAERALAAGFGGRGGEADGRVGAESDAEAGAGKDAGPGAVSCPENAAATAESGADKNAATAEPGAAKSGADENTANPEPDTEPTPHERIPISGTRAERFQVVLHVEPEALQAGEDTGEKTFRSELEDGTHVSAETFRRLSCDAGLVRVSHSPDGSILDVGRRTRTISPALRRALEYRDRGCRFPGCGLRFADAHHVKHWADGGETSLSNCVLVCRHHHRLVHEEGWKVDWWGPDRAVFLDPRGGFHFDGGWEPPKLGERPVPALLEQNRLHGATPDGWAAAARWKREADIPYDVSCRAEEAMLGG